METKFQIYEDEIVKAFLVEKPAIEGHVKIYPKKKIKNLKELNEDELKHVIKISSLMSTVIFENLSAHGTNIIVNDGLEELCINVLPRFNEDGLKINWEPKQSTREKLEESHKKLKPHMDFIGVKKPQQKEIENNENKTESNNQETEDEELDYRIRQLDRIP
ncbi:MAG: HIT family protein [Candidatus Woesearchaeota archaeon]